MRRRLGESLAILTAVAIVGALLLLPLIAVFSEALRQGIDAALEALADSDALAAIHLSLLISVIAVPINTVCGLAAAWCLAKHDFPGRRLLIVLVELPLSVSPVVAGLVWVLLFGRDGWFASELTGRHLQIIFALPGMVLATLFVTFPFVARTVMPLMQEQGHEQEEAAMQLGAGFWPILRRVTLPDIFWALLSGVFLCNARAMGEFGAVAVVSGHIPGQTETIPLHIETLYNDYQSVAAFTMAALLALLGLVTLAAKFALEHRHEFHGKARA
jgi:sulfate/thiosulfate transport system permease protein